MLYVYWQDGTKPNYGFVPFIIFGAALAFGIIIRLLKAKRGAKVREGLKPFIDAGKTYEALALAKPQDEDVAATEHENSHKTEFVQSYFPESTEVKDLRPPPSGKRNLYQSDTNEE